MESRMSLLNTVFFIENVNFSLAILTKLGYYSKLFWLWISIYIYICLLLRHLSYFLSDTELEPACQPNQAIFLHPKQKRPIPMRAYRDHRQTVRTNWWVSIRKQSAAPKASGEEQPKQPLIPNTLEVSAGRAGRSTALLLLIMMATAVKPRLMMVGSVKWIRKASILPCFYQYIGTEQSWRFAVH